MRNRRTCLIAGAGLVIVVGIWLTLTAGLSAQKVEIAATPVRFLPDRPAAIGATDVLTFTEAIYLPLVDYRYAPILPEKIAFETLRDGNYEIYTMNPDGLDQASLTNSPNTKDAAPAWAPDGLHLAFVSDRDGGEEIYVMNRFGSGIVRLTYNDALDGWPTWSPDGTQIAFQSDRTGNWDIFVMNADGSGQRQITFDGADDRWPDWSPDGAKILFVSNRIENYKKIFAIGPNGENLALLSDPNGYYRDRYPTWTPEGRITFTSNQPAPSDGSQDDEIYIMNANGSRVQQLTDNDAGDWLARWSPDGTRFAFYTNRDGNKNIYVKILTTGAETQITDNPSDEEYPAWSP